MGNSNQCKIEHKVSNDYESKAGRLCRELRLQDAIAHVVSQRQRDHTQLTLWGWDVKKKNGFDEKCLLLVEWLLYLNTQECTAKTANMRPQGCSSDVIYAQANLLHQD